MREIVLILHDIRSTHNVGSLFRTAEGLGVSRIIISGYTPYPVSGQDDRLPHLAAKIDQQIAKTALGAEKQVVWERWQDVASGLNVLKAQGFELIALEQADNSLRLPDYQPSEKLAILLGREVEGIERDLLKLCDKTIEIPMFGKKESFNVVQAAAMAIYHCRFADES